MKYKYSLIVVLAFMCLAACKKDGIVNPAAVTLSPTSARTTTFSLIPSTKDTVAFGINGSMRIQFAKDSVNKDNIVINFNPSSKSTYSYLEDAPYFGGFGTEMIASLSSDNVPLAINSLPLVKQSSSIDLKIGAKADGTYQLKLISVSSLPQIFEIWLMDAYRKDSINMSSNASYAVDVKIADNTSYGSHRFKLVIRENALRAVHFSDFEAFKDTSGVSLGWHTTSEFNYTRFTVQRSADKWQTFTSLNNMASTGLGNYGFLDKKPAAGAYQYRLKVYDINGGVTYSSPIAIDY